MMRFRRRRKRESSIPELSLTPMIDTALTLLIIFMVTTPMLQNAIKVNLPQGQSKEGGKETHELVVAVDSKGGLFLNNKPIALEQLGTEIKLHVQRSLKKPVSVWVHIDEGKSCGTLVGVVDRIKVAGGVQDVKIALASPQA